MAIKWNEYTWYSWTLALILFFFVLPAWSFYLGTRYQKAVDEIDSLQIVPAATIH